MAFSTDTFLKSSPSSMTAVMQVNGVYMSTVIWFTYAAKTLLLSKL